MKKLLTAISLILAAVILASCALSENDSLSADTKPEEGATYGYTNETASPSSYSEYRTAATDFSLEMLRNAYDGKDTVIPTAGLYSSLSLLNNIASGTTQLELKTLLGKKASATAINEGNGYFVSRLEAIKTKKASVKLDNNIFFEENTPVSGSVLRTNVSYYNHGLFKLNFSDSSSLDKANGYISEKSGGKAKELLSALSGNMTLSGTTVISDSWLGCFDESGSDMLTGTEYLLKGQSCKGFIKDFKGTPCKFVALLPDKDVSDLLKALNSESYSEIIESMNIFKTADVSIAPFKLESCEDYSGLVKKSGVSEIFGDGSFSGLTFRKTASTGAVAQYCSVNINAAGVNTSDKVKAKSKKQEAETKLSFDRPYVFFIIDNESNIPIISGIKG